WRTKSGTAAERAECQSDNSETSQWALDRKSIGKERPPAGVADPVVQKRTPTTRELPHVSAAVDIRFWQQLMTSGELQNARDRRKPWLQHRGGKRPRLSGIQHT